MMIAPLIWLALMLPANAATTSAKADNYPDTVFALPMVKGMRLDWALPPVELPESEKKAAAEARFAVDARGNPWFGHGKSRILLSPKQHIRLRTMGQFEDFAFVGGRDMVACDDKYLVSPQISAAEPKQENGDSVMDMIALVKLDHDDCRLFEAGPHKVYMVLRDDTANRDEITSIESRPGAKPKIRTFLRVGGSPISALAGDGDVTFYAQGKSIYQFKQGDKSPVLYFEATDDVRSLAYSATTGLFYATSKRAAFVSPKFQLAFLTTPDPQLALRGKDLYIRLALSNDVLKLSRADLFKTLAWADKK